MLENGKGIKTSWDIEKYFTFFPLKLWCFFEFLNHFLPIFNFRKTEKQQNISQFKDFA